MFELLLVACVGLSGCDTMKAPILYPSEERCQYGAALLAGMLRGRRPSLQPTTYEFSCSADGRAASWVFVPPRPDAVVVQKMR